MVTTTVATAGGDTATAIVAGECSPEELSASWKIGWASRAATPIPLSPHCRPSLRPWLFVCSQGLCFSRRRLPFWIDDPLRLPKSHLMAIAPRTPTSPFQPSGGMATGVRGGKRLYGFFLLLPFPSPTPQKSPLAGMEGLGGRGWEGQARQRHAGCGLGVLGRVVAGNR